MGQQLSVKAARTIHGRVVELIGGHPTPELVLAHDEAALRACGLSGAKIRAVQGIARAVQAGDIDLDALDHLPEEEAEAALVGLPGVGPWTAHMFLMFVLGHPDVVAPGDVGVRNGLAVIFDLDEKPTPKQIVAMAEPWRPYRTAACRLAWHVLDATPIDDYVPGREPPAVSVGAMRLPALIDHALRWRPILPPVVIDRSLRRMRGGVRTNPDGSVRPLNFSERAIDRTRTDMHRMQTLLDPRPRAMGPRTRRSAELHRRMATDAGVPRWFRAALFPRWRVPARVDRHAHRRARTLHASCARRGALRRLPHGAAAPVPGLGGGCRGRLPLPHRGARRPRPGASRSRATRPAAASRWRSCSASPSWGSRRPRASP